MSRGPRVFFSIVSTLSSVAADPVSGKDKRGSARLIPAALPTGMRLHAAARRRSQHQLWATKSRRSKPNSPRSTSKAKTRRPRRPTPAGVQVLIRCFGAVEAQRNRLMAAQRIRFLAQHAQTIRQLETRVNRIVAADEAKYGVKLGAATG
jgi:hypothetical protein